jgi:hypothetical protein
MMVTRQITRRIARRIARRITLQLMRRACRLLAIAVMLAEASASARAQNTELLMPEQSAQKARDLFQQTVQAMGGPAYVNLHDATCEGRLSAFGHSGDMTGFEIFYRMIKFPDKERIEHSKKRTIIEVFNGDKGWTLDNGGVADAPPAEVKAFTDHLKIDINHLLRYGVNEPGMVLRYAGTDVVDLKQVAWVELTDSESRTIRLALDSQTHFPVREVITSRDPASQLSTEQIYEFSNYHLISGVETPYQISSSRNGFRVFQSFIDKCDYDTGLSDSLFTKESLEERWAQIGKKKKLKLPGLG